jgi:hypothetical protein
LRFRSPLLSQSRFLSFPPGTEMVHFPGFARTRLWIHRAVRRFYQRGFPHSEIPGSMPACGSPRLIAACHVLRRLLLPRHPPCALSSLTIKLTRHTVASLQLSALSFQPSACLVDQQDPKLERATTRRVILGPSPSCSNPVSRFQVSSFGYPYLKRETGNCSSQQD